MVKVISKLNGISNTNQTRVSSWINGGEYTGLKVYCKTSQPILCRVEGSDNEGITIDTLETFKFAANDTIVLNLRVEMAFYRISIDLHEKTDFRLSAYFCPFVKENKVISFVGTYNVKSFNELNLSIFNRTSTTRPIRAKLITNSFSSAGNVLNRKMTLTIDSRISGTNTIPLTEKVSYGGLYFKTNPTMENLLPDYQWNEPVLSIFGIGIIKSLGVGVVSSSLGNTTECDDKQNLITFGKNTTYLMNDIVEDYSLRFLENDNYVEMETALNNSSFTFHVHINPYQSGNVLVSRNPDPFLGQEDEDDWIFSIDFENSELLIHWDNQTNNGVDTLPLNLDVPFVLTISFQRSNSVYKIYLNGTHIYTKQREGFGVFTTPITHVPLTTFTGELINLRMFPELLTDQQVEQLYVYDQNILNPFLRTGILDLKGIDYVRVEAEVLDVLENSKINTINKIHIEGLLS